MNPTLDTDTLSEVPWPTSDPRMPVPDTSMLPDSEKAAPPLQALDDGAAAAAAAIETTAGQAAETLDAWVEDLRAQIRGNPLATVAAAVVLGVVIARITR